MASRGVFVTGFPGFIAGRLVSELLKREDQPNHYYFLVLADFSGRARTQCRALEQVHPEFEGRWSLVPGDIRLPNLGIESDKLKVLREEVRDVWHLAAVYDLRVKLELAHVINVEGTLHVLEFCESVQNLERHYYISTCYVAGDRGGRVLEDELDWGQGFKNNYESTKFWAERLVRNRMQKIPTTVFRPAIVVGDSATGETVKGDGPYSIFRLLFRLPRWLPVLHVGEGRATVNVVPVNFLVEAMAELARTEGTEGKVFQLADPFPYRSGEILEMTIEALERAPAVGHLPEQIVRRFLGVPRIEGLVGVSNQTLEYFNHEVDFDVSQTQAYLKESGITCPDLKDYLPVLLDYAHRHPEIF